MILFAFIQGEGFLFLQAQTSCHKTANFYEESKTHQLDLQIYESTLRVFGGRPVAEVKRQFFERINKGEFVRIEESMAFTDYVAGSSYFNWALQKAGTVDIKSVWSRPYARLGTRVKYFELGWHSNMKSSFVNPKDNSIHLKYHYPKGEKAFFESMHILAMHLQTLAIAGNYNKTAQEIPFLNQVGKFFKGRSKLDKLGEIARMRDSTQKLRKLLLGLESHMGFEAPGKSRLPIQHNRWWVLLLELIPRISYPFYHAVERLPADKTSMEHFLKDRQQVPTFYMRLTGESAVKKYRFSLFAALASLYAWTLFDIGMMKVTAEEKAEQRVVEIDTQDDDLYDEENIQPWQASIENLQMILGTARAERYQYLKDNLDILSPMEQGELRMLEDQLNIPAER